LQFGQHKRDALLQYCLDCDARFDLKGEHLEDLAAKFRAIMAQQ